MGKKVRICLERQRLGMDENGKPCPAGICLTLDDEDGEEMTGASYESLLEQVKIEEVLGLTCLDKLYKPADCRLITPDEYDRKYGEDGEA